LTTWKIFLAMLVFIFTHLEWWWYCVKLQYTCICRWRISKNKLTFCQPGCLFSLVLFNFYFLNVYKVTFVSECDRKEVHVLQWTSRVFLLLNQLDSCPLLSTLPQVRQLQTQVQVGQLSVIGTSVSSWAVTDTSSSRTVVRYWQLWPKLGSYRHTFK